jgi:Bardet-Biedl syndrome 7 protein
VSLKEETLTTLAELLHPKFEELLQLDKQMKIIEALKELKVQEPELQFLSEEHTRILENSESIREKYKQQPHQLALLKGRNCTMDYSFQVEF